MNDPLSRVTTLSYDSRTGTFSSQPVSAAPLSANEMDALLRHLDSLKTNLLWLYFGLAQQFRDNPPDVIVEPRSPPHC